MTRTPDFRLFDGTVIDHLPVGTAPRALTLLSLPREGPITVGINVPSPTRGRKDIVRVEGMILERAELDRLALLGREITVSQVASGKVVHKNVLTVPPELLGVIRCGNPTCITRTEEVASRFKRIGEFPYTFRCAYCERSVSWDEALE